MSDTTAFAMACTGCALLVVVAFLWALDAISYNQWSLGMFLSCCIVAVSVMHTSRLAAVFMFFVGMFSALTVALATHRK
jgi:hypothetical protein